MNWFCEGNVKIEERKIVCLFVYKKVDKIVLDIIISYLIRRIINKSLFFI